MQKYIFISVIFHLYNGKGHVYSYQNSLKKSANNNNWAYIPIISKDPIANKIQTDKERYELSSNILDAERKLVIEAFKKFKYHLFVFGFIRLFYELKKILSNIARHSDKSERFIVFIESYNPLQLLALTIALLTVSNLKYEFWQMHRGGPNWGGSKHKLMARSFCYSFKVINLMYEIISKKRIKYFVDSDILNKSICKFYKTIPTTLPIPHTRSINLSLSDVRNSDRGVLNFWWPGSPRPEKGEDEIYRFALNLRKGDGVHLHVAESFFIKNCINNHCVIPVDDVLTEVKYYEKLKNTDCVLLPYNSELYSESTSGIFTESIAYGCTPFVSANTWMSSELIKHELSELVVDLKTADCEYLTHTFHNSYTKEKLSKMREHYLNFHNEQMLAQIFSISIDK